MQFSSFSNYLTQIESTPSRLEMTDVLAKLFSKIDAEEIDLAIYLMLGRLGPQYANTEFGLSSKLMQRIVAEAFGVDVDEVMKNYKEVGDLGDLSEELAIRKKESENQNKKVRISEVFRELEEIARLEGKGSQDGKIQRLAKLLREVDPLSVKYLTRIPIGKLRLGFSDMTVLDALSLMLVGDKSVRKQIEEKYNISADIGMVAKVVKQSGLEGLSEVKVTPGVPIRPAAADRLPGSKEIIEKLGTVAAEPKLDGFRLQVHFEKKTNQVHLYSRNLEEMTGMFPEVSEAVLDLNVDSVIMEGEAIGYSPETGDLLPFQETMQRRRKYDISEKAVEIPLKVFVFDLLYLNGESCLDKPNSERRKLLEKILNGKSEKQVINLIEHVVIGEADMLGKYFSDQIEKGLEGIVTKRLDAVYTAGKRNSNWVKLKREEHGDLNDTIDCVVLGYKQGTGKRARFGIGAFLVGVYDQGLDSFKTISNVGTGLTDDQWKEMKNRADKIKVDGMPARYEIPKELEQDVWVEPKMVVEILADEITRSPLHTTGKTEEEAGYALRFPRLVKWRDDKEADQATSVSEIKDLFKQQKQFN